MSRKSAKQLLDEMEKVDQKYGRIDEVITIRETPINTCQQCKGTGVIL